MLIETKKKLTYACITLSYLLLGIQYAIILPSLNLFITKRYGASTVIFGVIVSAYSVTGFLSGPLFGYIVDKKGNSRTVVILSNLTNIIGNIMYMLGISPLFLIFSRLVCGIGSGSVSAMFADITRSSSENERTGLISLLMFFQEFGLLFAPAFALALRHIHFYIGPFLIDKFTSPGLVMAILYGVLQIGLMFMYFNLGNLRDKKRLEESLCYDDKDDKSVSEISNSRLEGAGIDNPACHGTEFNDSLNNLYVGDSQSVKSLTDKNTMQHQGHKGSTEVIVTPSARGDKYDEPKSRENAVVISSDAYLERTHESMSSEMIESAERYITSMSDSESVTSGHSFRNSSSEPFNSSSFLGNERIIGRVRRRSSNQASESNISNDVAVQIKGPEVVQLNYANEFLREEIIVLFGLQFISAFSQTTLETILTPLSKAIYGWSDLENSYFFLVAGIAILIFFLILRFVSRCVSDRYLILFGLIFMIASYVWCIALFVPNATPNSLRSLPYLVIGALFDILGLSVLMVCAPSLMSKLTSREAQGFTQGCRRSCLFIGLILGPLWGGASVHQMNVLFGVPLGVLLIITILYLISFKKFKLSESTVRLNSVNSHLEDVAS